MTESDSISLAEEGTSSIVERSLTNLVQITEELRILSQKSSDYLEALEILLEGKTTPRRDVIDLRKKLRKLRTDDARIKEDLHQIELYLKDTFRK